MNEIIKFDNDQRLVFGWANIIKDEDGEVYVDSQGDFIEDIGELEKAAYDYVLHSRNGAEMHINQNVARVVESFVVTPDKLEALGLVSKSENIPAGWWIGFKVDNDDVWEKVKNGSYTGFSVHGKGQREIVDMTMSKVHGEGDIERSLKEHKKKGKHSKKHMDEMRRRIMSGDTMALAHSRASRTVGKGAGKDKISTVMREFYAKKLKNAQGKIVTDRGQAMAIAISESKKLKKAHKAGHPRLKDPKGGLTQAGREHFKRTEGANLKPGVKGPANTPEKMRRKGSFLTRFFTNPSGPMVKPNGQPSRLALSANAWGEPVPKNRQDAAKLAAKGRRLLERYQNVKKDITPGDVHVANTEWDYKKKKKKKISKAKPIPTKPKLWQSVLAETKSKFNVYPSAYANAWASKTYKARGGTWKMSKK
jgi:hypothetical protein